MEALADPNCGWFYRRDADSFSKIPGSPIAYWASEGFSTNFGRGCSVNSLATFTGSQNITADNAQFLRLWWEVESRKIGPALKWVNYAKGGDYRKWYGDLLHVVDWSLTARNFYKSNPSSNLLSEDCWYVDGITYTDITSGLPHFRYLPINCIFDKAGPSIVSFSNHLASCLALFNSTIASEYFSILNPTIHLQTRDVKNLPILMEGIAKSNVETIAKCCMVVSKRDWNSFETSRDFKRNPLV